MYESQRLREETLAELHQEEAEDVVTQYTEGSFSPRKRNNKMGRSLFLLPLSPFLPTNFPFILPIVFI